MSAIPEGANHCVDAAMNTKCIIKWKKMGCKVALVFVDKKSSVNASDSSWDTYWTELFEVVYVFMEGYEVDGVVVLSLNFAVGAGGY